MEILSAVRNTRIAVSVLSVDSCGIGASVILTHRLEAACLIPLFPHHSELVVLHPSDRLVRVRDERRMVLWSCTPTFVQIR